MSERNVIPEKEDYTDCGPMGRYDDPRKPVCKRCATGSFIMACGRDSKWIWSCTNCLTEWTFNGDPK